MLLAKTDRVENCRLVTRDSAVQWPGKSSWFALVSEDGWLLGGIDAALLSHGCRKKSKAFFLR